MPGEGHLAVCEEVRGVEIGGGSGKGQTHASPVPVPLHPPGGGFLRVAPVRPAAEFGPGKVVKPVIDRLAHPSAVIVRPTPDDGVELADQLPVREGLGMPNDPPKLRQMLLHVCLGGCDERVVPQTLTAPGAFSCLVFAHPILPDVTSQKFTSRLLAFKSVTDATFGLVQGQTHLCQPRPEQRLTVLKHLAIFVEHHAIIRLGDDPSLRGELSDGFVHSMEGNQR